MGRFTSFGPRQGAEWVCAAARRGEAGSFPENAPPIFFSSCRKENGPCTVQKKRRLVDKPAPQVCPGRGACESVRRGSMAPSSLRPPPVFEKPCTRITTAADGRGAGSDLPLLLSPRVTRCPGGCGRQPTAARLSGAGWASAGENGGTHGSRPTTAGGMAGAAGFPACCGGGWRIGPPPGSRPPPGKRQRKETLAASFTARPSSAPSDAGAQHCAGPPPAQGRRGRRAGIDRFARLPYLPNLARSVQGLAPGAFSFGLAQREENLPGASF